MATGQFSRLALRRAGNRHPGVLSGGPAERWTNLDGLELGSDVLAAPRLHLASRLDPARGSTPTPVIAQRASGNFRGMSSIRALSQELAGRSDAALQQLFAARPDLVNPAVPDFAALAARACARISVQRALDTLNRPQLQVLEALLVEAEREPGQPVNAARLSSLIVGGTKGAIQQILRDLNFLALLYRSPDGFNPVSSLYEVIGAHPAGLGRSYRELARTAGGWMQQTAERLELTNSDNSGRSPAELLADRFDDPLWWPTLIERAPENASSVLAKFDAGPLGLLPKTGRENPTTVALNFLLSEGVLVPLDAEHVELPREAGIARREGRILSAFSLRAGAVERHPVSLPRRDNAALGSIAELLREITALQEATKTQPLSTLRSGGVGIRVLRPLAQQLNIELPRLSLLLELAAAAGIIFLDADTSTWLPAVERWPNSRAQQWGQLSQAWLRLDRAPALLGQPLPGGQGTINALAAEARRADAPQLRSLLLHTLEMLSETSATQVETVDAEALFDNAQWERPRLWRRMGKLGAGILAEAELLGLTGSGALTDFGRLFINDQQEAAVQALEQQLPAAIDTILLQADLTAVAPGYLEPTLSAELALIAEREGHGPAATYRFSAASLRQAFDAGRTPQSIIDFLATHSSTVIPQPLEYLINDTAQRHGALRIEASSSIVRSSDEAMIAALLHDPTLTALRFRELAPGLLSSSASPAELARTLRGLGYSPALEGANEVVQPTRRPSAVPLAALEPSAPAELDYAAQIGVLRSKPAGVPANSAVGPQLSIETLREAIRTHRTVELTVVDGTGNPERLALVPLAVSNGRVRVFDPGRDTERVMSIHRIVDVDIVPQTSNREKND